MIEIRIKLKIFALRTLAMQCMEKYEEKFEYFTNKKKEMTSACDSKEFHCTKERVEIPPSIHICCAQDYNIL